MYGIVTGVTARNLKPIFLERLRLLEYHGYGLGIASLDSEGDIQSVRTLGKLKQLENKIEQDSANNSGSIGITDNLSKKSYMQYLNRLMTGAIN